LDVSPETVLNNGVNTNWARLTVRDVNDNPVPDVDVLFKVETGPVFTVSGGVEQAGKTDAKGEAQVELTSTVPGSFIVEGFIGASRVDGKPVAFSPGPATPANSTWTLAPSTEQVADGVQKFTATITAISSNLLAVPNARVEVAPLPAASVLTFTPAGPLTTDEHGQASVEITTTKAGSYPLAAYVGPAGVVANQIPGGTKTARFIPGPPVASHSRLEGPTSPAVVGAGTQVVTAWAFDEFDNPADSGQVVFTVPTSPAGLTPSGQVAVNISGGRAVLTLNSTAAGKWDIKGAISGTNIDDGDPAAVEFVPGEVSSKSELTIPTAAGTPPGTKTALGVEKHTARVVPRDANGIVVTAQVAVRFEVTAPDGSVLVTSTVNSANGVAELSWSSTQVGIHKVRAWVSPGGTDVEVTGSPASAEFVPGPPSYVKSQLVGPAGSVLADGIATQTVTLTVVDDLDHPIAGQAVELIPDASLGVVSNATVTDADGKALIVLTSTKPGSFAVRAKVGSVELDASSGSPAWVQYSTGIAKANESEWVVTPDTALEADGVQAFTATVTVRSALKHPVVSEPVWFNVPAEVSITEAGPFVTDAAGEVTVHFTSTVAGKYKATAEIGDGLVGAARDLEFVAGDPAVGPGLSSVEISDGPKLADGVDAYTITVTLRDAQKNPITGQASKLSVASVPADVVILSPVAEVGSGVYTVAATSLTVGTHSVAAAFAGAKGPIQIGSVTAVFDAVPDITETVVTPPVATPSTYTSPPVTTVYLPKTGAENLVPAVGGALGALLAGLLLLIAGRRRRREEQQG
jgi:LPXTG-motif cell wall-anchored protein